MILELTPITIVQPIHGLRNINPGRLGRLGAMTQSAGISRLQFPHDLPRRGF